MNQKSIEQKFFQISDVVRNSSKNLAKKYKEYSRSLSEQEKEILFADSRVIENLNGFALRHGGIYLKNQYQE